MARSSDVAFPLSLIRDKTFQVRQIRRVLLLTVFFIVQSTLVLGVFYHTFLGNLVAGNAPLLFASEDMGGMGESIPPMGTVLGQWLVAMLAVNGAVTFAIAIYIMRKLGNPILAIRRALNEIGDGNLDVRLRTNDSQEFSELCEALNRALAQVHGKIKEAQAITSELDSVHGESGLDEQTAREAMLRCKDVLSYFDASKPAGNDAAFQGPDSDNPSDQLSKT